MITVTENDILEIVTSSGADIDVQVTYSDFKMITSGEDDLPVTRCFTGQQLTKITGAGTNTIVTAPDGRTDRNIQRISIRNIDVLGSDVYVQLNNGTSFVVSPFVTLAVKHILEYEKTTGWKHLDDNGVLMVTETTVNVTSGTGEGWTDVSLTSGDFPVTVADDTRYYIPDGTTAGNLDVSALTTKAMFINENDFDVNQFTFTGATVYQYGGAESIDTIYGRGVTRIDMIGVKIIRTQ